MKTKSVFKNWLLYPLVYYNLIPKKLITFKTHSNKIIKIRKNSTDLMALTHVWLIEEYKRPNFEIQTHDIVIDIGAHIGLFSLHASQNCTKGKIYSFEPNKENFQLLLNNIESNALKNIQAFNLAVSNSNKPIKLYENNDQSGHNIFSETSKFSQVNSITLKEIFEINKIDICNFLKLDCEGAEYEILDNLPLEYFKRIKKFVIEYHMADSHPELLEKLKKLLISQNFQIETKILFSDIGFLYANNLTFDNNS
jgi:FkbM family methyltransferase